MDYLQNIAEWATKFAVGLLIWSNIHLWRSHFNFRQEVTEKYVRAQDMTQRFNAIDNTIDGLRKDVKNDLDAVRATTTRILELVAQIRGQINVHGTISS